MTRYCVPLLAVLLPGLATAQPPAKPQIVDAQVVNDQIRWTDTTTIPVTKVVTVEVKVGDKLVRENKTVTVYEKVDRVIVADLKTARATDATGKVIPPQKLAGLLKDPTPVVIGPVPEKHRALFKDSTVILELPPPPAPGKSGL